MSRSVKAIILAAGEGARLRPYTSDRPKCLVELGGKPLIVRQIEVLNKIGIDEINIVAGYLADKVENLGYRTFRNPAYAATNMVSSLMCAGELLDGKDDILIAYGDIVYEVKVIRALLACRASICTSIDKNWQRLWQIRFEDLLTNAETLKLDNSKNILEVGKKPKNLEEIEGQYMGLIKLSAEFAPRLVAAYRSLNPKALYDGKNLSNMFMTSFLQSLIDSGLPVKAVTVSGGWLEIDTAKDLELYNQMYKKGTLSDYCRI